jgi:CheY-like chemotaxis protein
VAKLILIAEDDDDDAWRLGRTLTSAGIANSLKRAHDGAEVIAYFKADGPFGDRKKFPMPRVLLLDLKMPRIGGLAVLEWLKGQREFQRGPLVVVLSGCYNKEDLGRACSLGARAFLIKPCTRHDVMSLVRAYPSCWDTGKREQSLIVGHKAPGSGGESARASK